ncbi:acid protease [Trichocladium antarcticum]|uniref:Acid protease n=1 Tax=Trichocladium antarcticum TaxID=1450529 RepID=A0AAN6Z8R2_9PEZI|nr:acid protease [Trichocladium antarcticum]
MLSQLHAPARNTTTTGFGTDVGVVSATPANNGIEYVSPVQIGGQTINVALDSGSADLWVFSTQLPAEAVLIPGAAFSILYGDGTGASGNVGADTAAIGGVTVVRQAVQIATAVSSAFVKDTHNNGLLGLGFSKLNTVKPARQRTFFDNVMPWLAEPLSTADLRRDAVGAYEFGRIDRTEFAGTLSWIPVDTEQGFWEFSTGGFRVDQEGSDWAKHTAAQAIADTGTTLMLVSDLRGVLQPSSRSTAYGRGGGRDFPVQHHSPGPAS